MIRFAVVGLPNEWVPGLVIAKTNAEVTWGVLGISRGWPANCSPREQKQPCMRAHRQAERP